MIQLEKYTGEDPYCNFCHGREDAHTISSKNENVRLLLLLCKNCLAHLREELNKEDKCKI